LLDGLDETQHFHECVMTQVRNFVNAPRRKENRVILTSRLVGFTSLGKPFQEYIIKPLEKEDELENFVFGWLMALHHRDYEEKEAKKEARMLVSSLRSQPALRRMSNNPLILRLAAQQYAGSRTVAHNRAELYSAYVKEAWQRAIKRGAKQEDKELAFQGLQSVAWHLQVGGSADEMSAKRALLAYKIVENESKAELCLRLAHEQMGLVVLVGTRLVFSHTTFREYFVAQRLRQAWGKNRGLTWRFLKARLHIAEWREPLLLLASLFDDVKSAEFLIRKVVKARSAYEHYLFRDILLAAILVAESQVSQPFKDRLYKVVYKRMLPAADSKTLLSAIEAIGLIGSPQSIPFLIGKLYSYNWDIRWAARRSLRLFGQTAIPFLRKAISEEKEPSNRMMAAQALRSLGDQALPILIDLMKNDYLFQRVVSERYWDRFEDDDYPFIGALTKKQEKPYHSVSQRDISNLLLNLQNPDSAIRSSTVHYLGEISDVSYYDAIFDLTDDPHPGVRAEAVLALGKLGKPQAMTKVIEALTDEYGNVKLAAVQALEYIGDVSILSLLLPLLGENYTSLRQETVKILGQYGDITTFNYLLPVLNDSAFEVRDQAADAIEQISDRLQITSRPGTKNEFPLLQLAAQALVKRKYYRQISKVLEKTEILESQSSLLQDPLHIPPPSRWNRVLAWVGWGSAAGLVFGLLGVLSKILDNTESYVLIAVLGMILGFLGWILDEIRNKLKSRSQ
jgi:HEAT repeat protein